MSSLETILSDSFKNINLTVACDDPIQSSRLYPEYKFITDFDKVFQKSPIKLFRYFDKAIRILKIETLIFKIIPLNFNRQYFANVKNADLIIMAAGGYFHEYYDYKNKLVVINKILDVNPNIIIFGQSIGPFNLTKYAQSVFNKLPIIMVRESISHNFLKDNIRNLSLGSDLAFYHKNIIQIEKKEFSKRVIVNFRSWNNDSESIITKAISLCNYLIDQRKIEVTFLSTCQGIKEYVDDSVFYFEIIKGINQKAKFKFKEGHFTPSQFMDTVKNYDIYIGMRLHGAIMAMLCNLPAFIIGYEHKSHGIYSDLGLKENEIYYTLSIENWLLKINNFIDKREEVIILQTNAIEKANVLLDHNIKILKEKYCD